MKNIKEEIEQEIIGFNGTTFSNHTQSEDYIRGMLERISVKALTARDEEIIEYLKKMKVWSTSNGLEKEDIEINIGIDRAINIINSMKQYE